MKRLRVMLLVHESLVPPDHLTGRDDPDFPTYKTEFDVKTALIELGHEVRVVGVYDDLAPIRQAIEEWHPHIAFNLMEDFAGNGAFDYYVVSYLEMMNVPYTGCNPRGLLLARDKGLSKKLLAYHRITVPNFMVIKKGRQPRRNAKLQFPLIVKSLMGEGSVGIAQASYVENGEQLAERVALIHKLTNGDAIAEQYIDGRELYATVLGNHRYEVLPVRELTFNGLDENAPRIATYKVKWDPQYRERWGIDYDYVVDLPHETPRIARLCKRVCRILSLNGYARVDMRYTADGQIYVLEANANPAIARDEDCAFSAAEAGMTYEAFIQRILTLGLSASKTALY
jgi:D-alanine-D-alanine ligase